MINMEPVLKRGYTTWDQDVLPADEFSERIFAVRAQMQQQGLAALVVVNYSLLGAMFEYADIAYLGGLQSGGVLLVLHDEEPTLISFGGGRELFFMRDQTWTKNVVPGKGQTFEVVRDLLVAHGVKSGAIGTTGIADMPVSAVQRFQQAFQDYALAPFDETLAKLRSAKRPRELMAIGIAKGIVDDAATAAQQVFADGGDNTAAMIEAERIARFHKARDVRVLVNMNQHELRPFEGRLEGRHSPLLLWVAAQYQGYWAEKAITVPASSKVAADYSVEAMQAAAVAGARAGDVAAAGLAALPADSVDTALQYGLGGTIGLALCEGVPIEPRNNSVLQEGAVISLHAFARGPKTSSIASRLIRIGTGGAQEVAALRLD